MENESKESGLAEIRELIRGEKETAGRPFEESRFENRIWETIRTPRGQKRRSFIFSLKEPLPAAGLSLAVIALGAFLLYRLLSPSPFEKAIQKWDSVLIQAAEAKILGADSERQKAEFTEFGWALKRILYDFERKRLEDVSLIDSLAKAFPNKTGQSFFPREGMNPPAPGKDSPRFRNDENFRKFITLFSKKFEEV